MPAVPHSLPVGAEEFSALMRNLGWFEHSPRIAVAVSGGADSMALALLAAAWAKDRGGEAIALTVDHGLRPDSAVEARQVGAWMAARGIDHHHLAWQGEKPVAGIQAAAREARYRLLLEWCRDAGVLHLLLAHHRDDQAETVLLRLGRGSGVDGLAGMAPVVEAEHSRLLRPFLGLPRDRLTATLRAVGQAWVVDPSNSDRRFARARLRGALLDSGTEDFNTAGVAASAARLAAVRAYFEEKTSALLAEHVTVHPAGFADISPALLGGPDEVCLRALGRLLRCIGTTPYAPRQERLDRLLSAMRRGGRGWTLAGCRILLRRGRFLICREVAAMAGDVAANGAGSVAWDGRFRLIIGCRTTAGLRLGALGTEGWRTLAATMPALRGAGIPPPVRPTLPTLRDEFGIFSVPHLGYIRETGRRVSTFGLIVFRPSGTLTTVGRCLV